MYALYTLYVSNPCDPQTCSNVYMHYTCETLIPMFRQGTSKKLSGLS